jgi:hypothetical protein
MYGSRGCTGRLGALCQQNCILAGTVSASDSGSALQSQLPPLCLLWLLHPRQRRRLQLWHPPLLPFAPWVLRTSARAAPRSLPLLALLVSSRAGRFRCLAPVDPVTSVVSVPTAGGGRPSSAALCHTPAMVVYVAPPSAAATTVTLFGVGSGTGVKCTLETWALQPANNLKPFVPPHDRSFVEPPGL